jgi:3-oxoacyl-(acyl-carrier-protein) synthase
VQTVTNACSSGADALGLGAAWIRSGICDAVLAGGADALSPISYAGFSALRLPSPDPCRPFDARRSGLTLGEGAGFLVLESESSRRARKVSARAFLAGYGTCTDAYHLTAPHPEGRGLLLAVRQAFAQARASWKDIAFINAHGTATETNDAAEGAFFRRCCPSIPFVATKGLTGHTLGAAGAMEAIFTLEHLKAGEIPPSPRFSEADPAIGTAPVSRSTPVRGRMALSQSLAFGGNNSVLIIARGDV